MKELKIGQKVYYAQRYDSIGVFEVIELKIRTIKDTYFIGVENKTKFSYLFDFTDLDKDVFVNRKEALAIVQEAEKNCKKKFSNERNYEEDIN